MKEYYLSDGENKRGAFSLKDLKNETVLPDTLIWKEGWTEWKTAKEAALIEPSIDLIINDTPPLLPKQEPKKKKKNLLKTIIKISEGDLEDLGELIGRREDKTAKGQSKSSGLNVRHNSLTVVFEILFRRQFGERYFDRRILMSVMFTLVTLKLFLSFIAYKNWFTDVLFAPFNGFLVISPYPFCVMDVVIVLVFILGVYHLTDQRLKKKQGKVIDNYFSGTSHFGFLGKYFKPENPQFGATLFIEPLIAFVFSFFLLEHSFIFGIVAILAAGRFWYENYIIYQESISETSQEEVRNSEQNISEGELGSSISLVNRVKQESEEETQERVKEKPSFTTMIYYAIGERLDKYLVANQDKINSSPFLSKIQELRIYFKGLNINQRKSVNFFISASVVFLLMFFAAFFEGTWSSLIMAPLGTVIIWSAYIAFSQIKILDNLLNQIMSWVYLLGFGLLPVPVKNVLTGIVKFIVFFILAVQSFGFFIGIAYLIYRIVIPFLDFKKLPDFEKA